MLFRAIIFALEDNAKIHAKIHPAAVYLLDCFGSKRGSTNTVFKCECFDNQTSSLCICCRILENNDIHQVSPMTFSGLNSLVLL